MNLLEPLPEFVLIYAAILTSSSNTFNSSMHFHLIFKYSLTTGGSDMVWELQGPVYAQVHKGWECGEVVCTGSW